MTNELEVIVGHTGRNLSAYIEGVPLIIVGSNMTEVRINMHEAIMRYRDTAAHPDSRLLEPFELRFKVDAATFINYYSDVFTKAALSRITGINERQLWHYAAGMHKPRKRQLKRIQEGIRMLTQELNELELL
ncbi:MAG: antitoxin HicB [Bacteroidales bacterium]|nr:antitoxin HicB [Bacteroidales bacterium]